MWFSHQDVRTGSKVGGKKKAHTAFYNKKREISNGKKRKEKHLTKEREAPDRRKGKQLIEGERNIR